MATHTNPKPGEDGICYICGGVDRWIARDAPALSFHDCALHRAAADLANVLEKCINRLHNQGDIEQVTHEINMAIAEEAGQVLRDAGRD